jgi:transposase
VIADRGLLKGKTVGVDATTLEANAAMRSIAAKQ